MSLDLAALPTDVDVLHRLVRELAAQPANEGTELARARAEVERLRSIIQRLQRAQFGRRWSATSTWTSNCSKDRASAEAPSARDAHDSAFMDRIHAYAPGWDYPKLNSNDVRRRQRARERCGKTDALHPGSRGLADAVVLGRVARTGPFATTL